MIEPTLYRWEACPAGSGISLVWEGGESQAAARLTGYDVSVRYVLAAGEDEGAPAQ